MKIILTILLVAIISIIGGAITVTHKAFSLGNNNGDLLYNNDTICKGLKDKLHHFKVIEDSGDSGGDDNNITKQSQEALDTIHDYLAECNV